MALFYLELTANPVTEVSTPITALNAVTAELGAERLQNINELTYYIVGGAGITVGAVQAEEAHVAGYAGTWAANGSPVTVVANAVKTIKVTGVSKAARIRVSTLIDGAGITVFALGR